LVAVAPQALDFGDETVGMTDTAGVTVTNQGAGPLAFSSVAITDQTSPIFAPYSTTCTVILQPDQSCDLVVSFTPQSVTSYTAALTLTDNAPDSPQRVPLSGQGVQQAPPEGFPLRPNPASEPASFSPTGGECAGEAPSG
jgi:hypothetical protein